MNLDDRFITSVDAPDDLPVITIKRRFRAPREIVFDAWTKPEHLMNWWGPPTAPLATCEVDLREGGAYRFVHRTQDGIEFGVSGVYKHVQRPERLVYAEVRDSMPELESHNELLFEDAEGTTQVVGTITMPDVESRDRLVGGVEDGSVRTQARLDELLEDRTLLISKTFEAPVAEVFAAWLDGDALTAWTAPHGLEVVDAHGEARVGEHWHATMRAPDGTEFTVRGVYRELSEPYRIVYSHGWENEDGEVEHETMLVATFESEDDHTRLTVHQGVFASESSRSGHASGWTEAFENLDGFVSGKRLDQSAHITALGARQIVVARLFHADPATLFDAFNNADVIPKWLGVPAMPMHECSSDPTPGGSFRYVWRGETHGEAECQGKYLEVEPNKRTVHEEWFTEDWTNGPARCETTFEPFRDGTMVRLTFTYADHAARQRVLASGWSDGFEINYQQLDTLLCA